MAYRPDPDLEFLQHVENYDLDILVKYLTTDKDGSTRLTEELTIAERYKKYSPNHQKYWDLIAAELQCFGGNTLVTIFRGGKGVFYREILMDVCDHMKVRYDKKASVEKIELSLLFSLIQKSLNEMSEEELEVVVKELDLDLLNRKNLNAAAVAAAIQALINSSGFAAYKMALIVANAVSKFILGQGIKFGSNIVITRTLSIFAGPIGWIFTGLWTLIDIAGPAYRVTIPSVIQVAYLRLQNKNI